MVQAILFRIIWAFAIFIDKKDFLIFFRLIFIKFKFVSQVMRSSGSPLCQMFSRTSIYGRNLKGGGVNNSLLLQFRISSF